MAQPTQAAVAAKSEGVADGLPGNSQAAVAAKSEGVADGICAAAITSHCAANSRDSCDITHTRQLIDDYMMTESVQGSIGAAAVTLEFGASAVVEGQRGPNTSSSATAVAAGQNPRPSRYKAPPKGLPSATSSAQPPPWKSAPDQAPPTAQPPQVKRHFAKAPTVGVPHCPMPTRLPPGHPDTLPHPPAHPANCRGEGSTGWKAAPPLPVGPPPPPPLQKCTFPPTNFAAPSKCRPFKAPPKGLEWLNGLD